MKTTHIIKVNKESSIEKQVYYIRAYKDGENISGLPTTVANGNIM